MSRTWHKLRTVRPLLFLALTLTACSSPPAGTEEPFDKPAYWKEQALEDILPPWTQHALDPRGGFLGSLDGDWKPTRDTLKYPSMIARHLFSYAVAYLMSGDDTYLEIARKANTYLIEHAWDKEYGGWFNALKADGTVADAGKSTFVQVYVITGLAMYYFVERDPHVLEYIDRSNHLLEQKVWDASRGGYFDDIGRDWTVQREVKSFASQLAPVSGYLLYLYLATGEDKYLKQAERISDAVLDHMIDPRTGWVLESFDKDWKYLQSRNDEEEINVGHNIEAAWCLARLYRLNGRDRYLEASRILTDSLHRYGFNSHNGFWYYATGNESPEHHSDFTYWWIQAYGNMFELFMGGLQPDVGHLENFRLGASFWDRYFIDSEKGDTHFSVMEDGTVQDRQKANPYKSSYHNMEHCLLNFLYLTSWVTAEPVTLHFSIREANEGYRLYPLPIEKKDAIITEVRIDGKRMPLDGLTGSGFVRLPALRNSKVSVVVR